MRNKIAGVAAVIIGLALLSQVPALAFEARLGTVGTDGGVGAAQQYIFGAKDLICIYCTNPDAGSSTVRYTMGNSQTITTATSTNSSAPITFPGDCYRIVPCRGCDRMSIIETTGTGAFNCEIDGVLK